MAKYEIIFKYFYYCHLVTGLNKTLCLYTSLLNEGVSRGTMNTDWLIQLDYHTHAQRNFKKNTDF